MKDDITIKLNTDQRFLIESGNDCCIMLVDEICIMPNGMQMTLTGKYFDVDYENMDITRGRPMHMNMSIEENTTWSDDDE